MDNRDRADIAADCLDVLPDADQNDSRTNVIDLLTNLRHYCDYALINFDGCVSMSEVHWLAERTTE